MSRLKLIIVKLGRNPVLEGRFYIVFFFDYYRLGAGWLGVMRVLHFQRDNYRLKLPSPVRIVFCSFEPPFQGDVSLAKV